MEKLKFADASFLYAETAHAPMNIGSVQLLEIPPDLRKNYFDNLVSHLQSKVAKIGFMTRKLVNTPFGLDHPIWVTDTDFDIRRHVHSTKLRAPGSFKQLETLIGQLHEKPLDRHYPLWQFHLIEGLEDGRCAWYTKYHHACIDGMAGQQIIEVLFADEPSGKSALDPPPVRSVQAPPLAAQWLDAMVNVATEPMLNMLRMGETMRVGRSITELLSDPEQAGAYAQRAPKTPFNVGVSQYRNVAFGSLSLSAVRAVGKVCQASVNDIFMAVCAGGLRRYLERKGELPAEPLIASVPVSLRQPGDANMENRVSMLLASLATDIADPMARLDAIRQSLQVGKQIVAKMSELPTADPHLPGMPMAAATLAQFAENLQLAEAGLPAANVVISNVPGPRTEKYLCGAKMTTHYPVSIAANGAALNITVQSYVDRMDFSITTCLEVMPDAADLCTDILDAWQEQQLSVWPTREESGQALRVTH